MLLIGALAAATAIATAATYAELGADRSEQRASEVRSAAAQAERPRDIPPLYMRLYRDAARTCTPLDWALLAGVGKVETNHGRSPLPGVSSGSNSAGAAGPMQFLPTTFAGVRDRHPEVGSNIYNPRHAISAAAHYLCDSGAASGAIRKALWAYNHADWYVDKVKRQAARYRAEA